MGSWSWLRWPCLGALVVLVIVATGEPSPATTVLRFDDRELAERAEEILRGRLLDRQSYFDASGMIVTAYTFAVDEVMKGDGIGSTFTLVQPGGQVGDQGLYIAGVAQFRPGEESVIFVAQPDTPGTPTFTVGLSQGKFCVDRPPDEPGGCVHRDLEGLELFDASQGGLLSAEQLQAISGHSERLDDFRRDVQRYVSEQRQRGSRAGR